jgi:FGGY-family pentulose kinase
MVAHNRSRSSLTLNQLQQIQNPGSVDTSVFYVGVDVGTGSARAAVVDNTGSILALAERPIQRQELKANYITQSTTEIWNAIAYCVKSVVRDSEIEPSQVLGIGFDATCSLAVLREDNDEPLGVGPDFSNHDQNIILWMDHRAVDETNEINATGDKCLKYVGGTMSIEMELPKMKWLKNHLPDKSFEKAKFYDLADFLTHKATGSEARSYNSTVCKQGFVPPGVEDSKHGWSEDFLNQIDLPELVEDKFRRLGGAPGLGGTWLSAGDVVGPLNEKTAEELGLTTDCLVGSGVIDAYAGWVGTVAAQTDIPIPALVEKDHKETGVGKAAGRLAAVAGTSTCHIALSKDPIFVEGVWGPYRDAIAPDFWLAEGGQSCTGALLAHVLNTHPAYSELARLADASNVSKFEYLNAKLEQLAAEKGSRSVVALAKHLFFYGDYHGNRSPIADPRMKASIIGQSMDTSVDDLAVTYLAACEFIAQQTRQIVEKMVSSGHRLSSIFMSGGQCRNGLLMRLLADCTGLPIIIPRYIDAAVVFGAALLGAVAAKDAIKKKSQNRSRSSSFRLGGLKPLTQLHAPDLASPYTAPSATASTTNFSAIASQGGFPFPSMTSNMATTTVPEDSEEEDEEEEEGRLSFGANKQTQTEVESKLRNLRLQEAEKAAAKKSHSEDLWNVMVSLSGGGKVVVPSPETSPDRQLLNAKYQIFLEQAETQRKYRDLVDKVEFNIAEGTKA